jgi:hypothetical protein
MNATKPQRRTCDVCKYDGGWHLDDPDHPVRCPNWFAADEQAHVQQLTVEAHTRAFKAAKAIIADTARSLPTFSGNDTRAAMEDAQIPSGVIGAAFSASVREGVIEASGRYVQSTEPSTRHRIIVWSSLHPRWHRPDGSAA